MRSFRLCSCWVVTPKDDPVRLTASRYDFKRMRQTLGIPRREEPTRKHVEKGFDDVGSPGSTRRVPNPGRA